MLGVLGGVVQVELIDSALPFALLTWSFRRTTVIFDFLSSLPDCGELNTDEDDDSDDPDGLSDADLFSFRFDDDDLPGLFS